MHCPSKFHLFDVEFDKPDELDFEGVVFHFLEDDNLSVQAYGVYISQR